MVWTWVSMAPAVAMRPSPLTMRGTSADDDVDAVQRVGVTGAPDAGDPPLTHTDRHLAHTLHRVDQQHVADHQVARVAHGRGSQVHPVAGGLAEAGQELLAGLLRVVLDLDDEPGVGQHDAVSRRRPVDTGAEVRHRPCRRGSTRSWPSPWLCAEVAASTGSLKRPLECPRLVERPVDQSGEADQHAVAAERPELHDDLSTRVEALDGAGRYGEPAPRRPRPGRTAAGG